MAIRRLALVMAFTAMASGLAATTALLVSPARAADAAESVLPEELFRPGVHVRGLGAVYQVEEVRGGWIRAVLFRSLDEHDAPAHEARWIYVPACGSPWSKAP